MFFEKGYFRLFYGSAIRRGLDDSLKVALFWIDTTNRHKLGRMKEKGVYVFVFLVL